MMTLTKNMNTYYADYIGTRFSRPLYETLHTLKRYCSDAKANEVSTIFICENFVRLSTLSNCVEIKGKHQTE